MAKLGCCVTKMLDHNIIPNIIYSSDLVNWNLLPELPNKNNSNKELLLFTYMGNEYLIYYKENNSVICYSISIESNAAESWERRELNLPAMIGNLTMQHTDDGIYCFAPFDKAFKSNDGYSFKTLNVNTSTGTIIKNEYIPLKVQENKCYTIQTDEQTLQSNDIQSINKIDTSDKIWTGNEYLFLDTDNNQITKTEDGINYQPTEIPISNYDYIYTNNTKTMLWNGEYYMARVGGYEAPKLRGGALENGRTVVVKHFCNTTT